MRNRRLLLVLTVVAITAAACGASSPSTTSPAASTTLAAAAGPGEVFDKTVCAGDSGEIVGRGATFPAPLYQQWIKDYNALCPSVTITYDPQGSGAGITAITQKAVDFGASDAPMKDDEVAKVPGGRILHLPTTLGGIVLAFNLPGVTSLKLTPATVCGIFLGRITMWNDPQLTGDNPGLPATAVVAVHRADSSGTTNAFTTWLTATCPDWKGGPGAAKEFKGPGGVAGKGNDGVADGVKQNPGGLGYVELNYAQQNDITVAQVRNKAGSFVTPSSDAISAAFASLAYPDDLRFTNPDPGGAAAYPIVSATWILEYPRIEDRTKAAAFTHFMAFVHSKDAQAKAAQLGYAPLPTQLLEKAQKAVQTIQAG